MEITPRNGRRGVISTAERLRAVRALDEHGFVVLHRVIDVARLARIREAMRADTAKLMSRAIPPHQYRWGHLQQDPPVERRFLYPEVLLNEVIYDVTRAVLGRGVKNCQYRGNVNLPGSVAQPTHVDWAQFWPGLERAHPAAGLVVNVPLVAMDTHNGSTEIWPGTHCDTTVSYQSGSAKISPRALEARRRVAPPVQPTVPLGSVLIRDLRAWHRGMPNRSNEARPMLGMLHACRWWTEAMPLALPLECEPLFARGDMATDAVFVDGPIDHLARCFPREFSRARSR
jgi:ectoine hydroxylase-related dioxygenase (phytanoyl-CoA dioxygenase family)